MLSRREDQKAQVLEDKKVNEPHYNHDKEVVLNESNKKFKLSISQPKDLDRSNCDHYALDSNSILRLRDVYRPLVNILEKGKFKVRRIKKSRTEYIRLSISHTVNSETKERALRSLKTFLRLKIKKLKMRPNFGLIKRVKPDTSQVSILTFNINNLKNKVEELDWHLQKEKPTIVCLQETRRPNIDRRVYFNGYSVDEIPVGETGLGLLIGVRKDLDLSPKIITKTENIIAVSVNTTSGKLVVINVYRANSGPARKQAVAEVTEIFSKYENKDCQVVAVGDWNSSPEEVMRQLKKANIPIFADNVPSKGTRIKKNRRRTKKVIDFGVSSKEGLIISQTRRRKWNISDHVPILVRVGQNQKKSSPERKLIFDKSLLSNKRLISKLMSDSTLDLVNGTAEQAVSSFNSFWQSNLRQLKIIREDLIIDKSEQLPKRVKNLIKNKRIADKLVRKGNRPLEEFLEAKKAVNKALREHRRNKYLQFIKRGIEFLKNNDSRNSWRWIKRHCKIERNAVANVTVTDPVTKYLVEDQSKRMKVWADHFYHGKFFARKKLRR